MDETIPPKKLGGRRKRRLIPWITGNSLEDSTINATQVVAEHVTTLPRSFATGREVTQEMVAGPQDRGFMGTAEVDSDYRLPATSEAGGLPHRTRNGHELVMAESTSPVSDLLNSLDHFPYLPHTQKGSDQDTNARSNSQRVDTRFDQFRSVNQVSQPRKCDLGWRFNPLTVGRQQEADAYSKELSEPSSPDTKRRNIESDPAWYSSKGSYADSIDCDDLTSTSPNPRVTLNIESVSLNTVENPTPDDSRATYTVEMDSPRPKQWHTLGSVVDQRLMQDLTMKTASGAPLSSEAGDYFVHSLAGGPREHNHPGYISSSENMPGSFQRGDVRNVFQQPATYHAGSYNSQILAPTNVFRPSFKKALNVDSPSFTPANLSVPIKGNAISSQAVNAAPFTPRGVASGATTPNAQLDAEPSPFNPAQITEFKPQGFALTPNFPTNGTNTETASIDPFSMSTVAQNMPPAQYNPYLDESNNMAANGVAFYQNQNTYTASVQPLQYHLYAPIGPHREDLLAYQKLTHDFFIPEKVREELQKKNEASLQVMPNSQLPTLEHYHTLVPLDTSHHKSATVFGYPSWVYKATSSKNGNMYCLRRLEGYRLTNEKAIRSVKEWRRVDNGSIVSIVDAFTTRVFGDSSLIFVTNYHPLSKTLVEHHFTSTNRYGHRPTVLIPEQTLWGYIVQVASAIKAVHTNNLAVRCMEPSKILITEKDRIRLSACSVLDVVHHDAQREMSELQQEDLIHLGKLIAIVATNNLTAGSSLKAAVEQIGRNYSGELRDTIIWLLTPASLPAVKTMGEFLAGISGHIVSSFDSSLHANDFQTSVLSQELENGRLFRLMAKLGTINERPEYEGDKSWSETGDRYMLKLFRDYVFHQVDAEGRPVVDLAHILRCLNKLDAGIDERIFLTSRDDQSSLVITYKELKKQFISAFGELLKPVNARY